MASFSLSHLSDAEFEGFCYDLLNDLGFINVSWRKGTNLSSSPSDQGRDIECYLSRTDIDGTDYSTKWFVECKHYEKGVPPTAIQSVLTWAEAADPDVVLIITSGFLSNPTKNHLNDYARNRKPRFRIKVWERPDLEKLTLGKARLLRKYRISGEFPILTILHPAHILYMKKAKINTLDYLFEVLDGLDSKKRDHLFSWVYRFIIKPKSTYYTSVIAGMEITVTDQTIEEVSYEVFKKKCYLIANILDGPLLVFLIVNWVLLFQLAISDLTAVDEFIQKMEDQINFGRRVLEKKPEDRDFQNLLKNAGIDISDKRPFEFMIEFGQEKIENYPEDVERNYKLYEYFCDNVLKPLLLQEIFPPISRANT